MIRLFKKYNLVFLLLLAMITMVSCQKKEGITPAIDLEEPFMDDKTFNKGIGKSEDGSDDEDGDDSEEGGKDVIGGDDNEDDDGTSNSEDGDGSVVGGDDNEDDDGETTAGSGDDDYSGMD